jgi:hypothetical protein
MPTFDNVECATFDEVQRSSGELLATLKAMISVEKTSPRLEPVRRTA